MGYINDLVIKSLRGTPLRMVLYDFEYMTKEGILIRVPAGFITDYASIPPFLKWFIDPDEGGLREPSVIHDFLYTGVSSSTKGHRKYADTIFKEAMLAANYPKWKTYLVYLSVRLFGKLSYEN